MDVTWLGRSGGELGIEETNVMEKRNTATILIVEDHALSRQMLKSLLGYLGHRVLEAADGSAALALARSGHPDLIISDIAMPVMDGLEFVSRLRADAGLKGTPVLFYTAIFKTPEARQKAEAFGSCRVIEKPSEPAFILQTVNEMLELSPSETVSQAATGLPSQGRSNYDHLHGSGLQLATLMDFSFHLVGQRDPARLLSAFCRAAMAILKCESAVLGLVEEGKTRHFLGKVEDQRPNQWHSEVLPSEEAIARLMAQRTTLRRRDVRRAGRLTDSPVQKTQAGISSLTVPFSTPGCVYGWFCLINKLDQSPFGDEDEELAVSLCSQAAIAYENILLAEERKRKEEEIKALNNDLKRQVALLEAANKELEGFSYSVSHDLRAPLRYLTSFVELLNMRQPEALDEKSRHYLDVISDSAKKMGSLIDDLLSFARIGRAEMVKRKVSLGSLVTEALQTLKPETEGREILWKIDPLPEGYGDPAMLGLVLTNLIANAIKFTRSRPQAIIEIGCLDDQGDDTVFYIKDNGAGFDMKYVDKLFVLFQRLHHDDEFEGAGVGLANVRRVISKHGGRTWAEGAKDCGATFYFSLPKK